MVKKLLLIFYILFFSYSHVFSFEDKNFIQINNNSKSDLKLFLDTIDNNIDKENLLKKQKNYYTISITMFTFSSISLVLSFIFGGFAFFED